MEPFELLLHKDALEVLRKTRGENRKQLRSFFSVLPTNPYIEPDGSYEDNKGRIVNQIKIRNYIVEFVVDDPMKEIKVLELNKITT